MKLITKIILISLWFNLCLIVPSWPATIDDIENDIITSCKTEYTDTSDRYYCMLSQLYAFNKVIDYYREYYNTPHIDVFDEIWKNNTDQNRGMEDFIVIEKGIRTYLENLDR